MNQGFTFIELVFTIGILVLIFAIGVPVSLDFYLDYQLVSETRTLVSVLRQARNLSMINYNESDQKVIISADNFNITPANQNFPRVQSISVIGPSELVFEALSGRTSSSTITLSNGQKNKFIYLNEEGQIKY